MDKKLKHFIAVIAAVVLVMPVLTGCGRSVEKSNKIEERDPLVKRALEMEKEQNIDAAIELYNKALWRKPDLALPHLKLGNLYDEKQDYVRAVYHYQRYLELRPEAQVKSIVEEAIRLARLNFAATIPEQTSAAIKEISLLKKEIQTLREQLAAVRGMPASSVSVQPGASVAKPNVPAPKPEPAQPPVRTYTVQSGDTLSSIAIKMYQDSNKWKTIYDANRNVLSSPQSAKVGQTLIIPR